VGNRPVVKACSYCKHCEYEEGFAYSEMTWSPESLDCHKGHFSNKDLDDLKEGELYLLALNCDDFELNDKVKEYLNTKG